MGLWVSAAVGQTGLTQTTEPISDAALAEIEANNGLTAGELVNLNQGAVPLFTRFVIPNLRVASILNRLDIDGDGLADNARDTDRDGLPDNWESGGFEALGADGERPDRVVFIPAPSPMVPGTPPTPIFTRLAVTTSALNPDTDGDGLSDFIEVFGLKYIDENRNGILDDNEWVDRNGDGMPSAGEWAVDNTDLALNLLHDFDGFVFTDPSNPDTDGDGRSDLDDNDPLINPRAFGSTNLVQVQLNLGDQDLDNDGLGDSMDMGNDLTVADQGVEETRQIIDNPQDVEDLVGTFRPDLLEIEPPTMPEAVVEDLFGLDWDGNGLWRTTDVRDWSPVVSSNGPPDPTFFRIDEHRLYAFREFADVADTFNDPGFEQYGGRGLSLGFQRLLEPASPTIFMPDRRIYGVLYGWRVPGFDIDGDGFVGAPTVAATAPRGTDGADANTAVAAIRNGRLVDDILFAGAEDTVGVSPFDDRIAIPPSTGAINQGQIEEPALNGRIAAPEGFPALPCGALGITPLLALGALPLGALWRRRVRT